jgi:pyruvate/2-oxoglutarate dehydrogenase complex dihydrolipoamide acyltransferase (E2) component
MPAKQLLTIPPFRAKLPRVVIHWLKQVGEHVAPLEPVARLQSQAVSAVVRAPEGCTGTVEELLVPDGAQIIAGEPLVRIGVSSVPDDRVAPGVTADAPRFDFEPRARRNGLAETTADDWHRHEHPRSIVARLVSMKELATLARIGGISLAGLLTAAVAMVAYALLGGALLPLIGGLALATVAGALAYGRHRLARADG